MHIRFAVACVENACELVRAIEKAAGDQATGAWWWSLFCTDTQRNPFLKPSMLADTCWKQTSRSHDIGHHPDHRRVHPVAHGRTGFRRVVFIVGKLRSRFEWTESWSFPCRR